MANKDLPREVFFMHVPKEDDPTVINYFGPHTEASMLAAIRDRDRPKGAQFFKYTLSQPVEIELQLAEKK